MLSILQLLPAKQPVPHHKLIFYSCSTCAHHSRTSMKLKCCYFGCNKSFPCKAKLTDHINAHLNIRPHSCGLCGKEYTSKKHLHAHMQIHSEPKFKCEECNRYFTYNYTLKRHKRVCERVLSCVECGKSYVRTANLEKHMERKHRSSRADTSCFST